MRGLHPTATQSNRTVVYAGDSQLLKPFDAPYDVDERIHGAHLVQRNPIGREPMHSALSLAEQLECAYCPLSHPGRKLGAFHDADQLANVAMRTVVLAVGAVRAV
jgi:hypothetical protein